MIQGIFVMLGLVLIIVSRWCYALLRENYFLPAAILVDFFGTVLVIGAFLSYYGVF